MGYFLHNNSSKIVIQGRSGCSNELVTNEEYSFIVLDVVFNQKQARHEHSRSSGTPLNLFFRAIKYPHALPSIAR